MTSIDLASNSALLQVAEKLAEQNALLGKVAIRGESAFIRYSAYADGTDFTETWSAGQNYIGHATGLEAPTDKEGYVWSLFASNIRETLTVTLKKDGWLNNTQIIETVQLGETGSVFPSPKPESQEAYLEAGIVISAATDNALVFTCLEVPEVDLVVDIQVTEPLAVIGGTGVSSWNELLDKPFGEYKETVTEEMTVEWDGVVGDRTVVQTADGNMLVHVSDCVFPGEGATGAHTVGVLQDGSYVEESAPAEACGWYGEVGIVGTGFVISIPADNTKLDMGDHSATINGLVFPKKGLYFLNIPGNYVITKYTGILSDTRIVVKKLDEKYLPDNFGGVRSWNDLADRPFYDYTQEFGDTVTWDGKTVDDNALIGLLHCYSNSVPTIEELKTGTVVIAYEDGSDDEEVNLSDVDVQENAPGAYYIGIKSTSLYLITEPGALAGGMALAERPGIYATSAATLTSKWVKSLTIPGHNFFKHYHKSINSSFLPITDWDAVEGQDGYIKNRPFGNVIGTGDTLTWGVETGETMTLANITWHHMCDWAPAAADLVGATLSITAQGQTGELELTESHIARVSDTIFVVGDMTMFVALVDNTSATLTGDAELVFPKAGIYFVKLPGVMEVNFLRVPNHEFPSIITKTIDPKYLPEPLAYEKTEEITEETTVTWDGVIGDRTYVETTTAQGKAEYYVHVSGLISPNKQSWIGKNIGYISGENSKEVSVEEQRIVEVGEPGSLNFAIHNAYVIQIQADNTTIDFGSADLSLGVLTFPKKGIYFMSVPDMSIYVSSCNIPYAVEKTEIKTIDEKYLPETIARTEYVDEMATRAKQEAENDVAVVLTDYTKKEELTWDNLSNKPFGEGSGVTTLVFDGQAHGRETHTLPGTGGINPLMIKVSDEVPDESAFIGQSFTIKHNDEVIGTEVITADFIGEVGDTQGFGVALMSENAGPDDAPAMLMVFAAPMEIGDITLTPGIWLGNANGFYFSELNYFSETGGIKKIDEKYLPDPIAYDRTKELNEFTTVEWDGVVGDRLKVDMNYYGEIETTAVYMGPYMPSPDLGIAENSVFGLKGTNENGEWEYNEQKLTEYEDMGNGIVGKYGVLFIPEDNHTCDIDWGYLAQGTYTFPKKGMYFLHNWEVNHTFESMGVKISANLYYRIEDFKQIDEKFIPDTIARVSDLQALQEALGAYITDINALLGGDE